MNRKSLFWGMVMVVLAARAQAAFEPYEFAVVSNSITAGANLSAVANNGNVFVCVGANNSPVLAVNTNNFGAFVASNPGGGYLLFSNAWTNTLKSPIKYTWLNCVAAQTNGFIASGLSNAVLVSSDGVNWTNWGSVLASGNSSIAVDGLAYNPVSATFAAALAIYKASWTTNPISTNVWQNAPFGGESFAESFRGVTSFASSNMAMCGILGDIRISTGGGENWSVSQQVNSSLPNLLGVASDGGSNLVCAGEFSMLEISTNGGPNTTWTFQTNMNFKVSGSATNFNAVAYNPVQSEFLAAGSVGGNGLIAIASEQAGSSQWAWTRQTNLWQYQNGVLVPVTSIASALNGAAFASSGFFQGISLLVGDNGTVMIGGYTPNFPLNPSNVDVTNVLANPLSNAPLTADIIGNTNYLTVDWYAAPSGGTPLAFNALTYQPTNESCGTYTNWAAERDLRTGFTSTSRTPFIFTIIPGAPGNPISETNCNPVGEAFGMCAGTPMSVTVVTNAANPPGTIQVNWYDAGTNLVATTELSPNSDVMAFPGNPQISPFIPGGIFTYYAQATNPATGFASTNWTTLTYQVNPLPTWTSSLGFSTNALLANPQVNPVIANPGVANLLTITGIEPGAVIAYDWYTNGDPTVATYNSPNPPFALTGVEGFPSEVEPASGVIAFIPTNVLCGTYTYYVRARVAVSGFTSCNCESTNLIPVTFTLLPPPPVDAIVNLTNVLSGFQQANTPLWVDLVTNAANPPSSFKVNWFSTAQNSNNVNYLNNGTETNSGDRFFHTPNNAVCGVYTNWAETMAKVTGSGSPIVNTNRIPVVFVIIPAAPAALTASDVSNCVEVPNPTFVVAVTNGQTANWYTVPPGGTPVATGLNFTPTNSSPGTWTFQTLAVDPASGLVSTGSVLSTLSLYECTNPLAISLNPSSETGTIQWPGNLTLLSTTNLNPPIVWTSVSTGSVFSTVNTLTFTNTNPPVQFFRLTN